jgi:hypothetical protein
MTLPRLVIEDNEAITIGPGTNHWDRSPRSKQARISREIKVRVHIDQQSSCRHGVELTFRCCFRLGISRREAAQPT